MALVTLAYVKDVCGLGHTTAQDAMLNAMIDAAHDEVVSYLQQPIERAAYTGRGIVAASPLTEWGVVPLRYTINPTLVSVESGGDDITALSAVDNGLLLVPTDYLNLECVYTVQSGWTTTTVPAILKYVLARLVYYYWRNSGLSLHSSAGLESQSTSDAGVVVQSKQYDLEERQRLLKQLDQWRRL